MKCNSVTSEIIQKFPVNVRKVWEWEVTPNLFLWPLAHILNWLFLFFSRLKDFTFDFSMLHMVEIWGNLPMWSLCVLFCPWKEKCWEYRHPITRSPASACKLVINQFLNQVFREKNIPSQQLQVSRVSSEMSFIWASVVHQVLSAFF